MERLGTPGKPIRGRRPTPGSATHKSRRQANLTDPDSRLLKTKDGYVQGYNAQAVATTDQFVIAAGVTNLAMDAPAYAPMVTAAKRNLKAAGERRRVHRVVADAGYWSVDNVAIKGVESFIAPGRARQLKKIAETEQARTAILDRVEAGEIDTLEASEQLWGDQSTGQPAPTTAPGRRSGPADHHDDRQARQSARPKDL